jgi:tetratricopeptide (TPR) repeat protein
MLSGSIAGLGSDYVIGLKAVSCNSGDVLAETQEQAPGKEAVLQALDRAATNMRGELGESLSSVQKYATPLEQATTPSLEALQAFSLAVKALKERDDNPATVTLSERAIRFDPNFAAAYALLGVGYNNLSEPILAASNLTKAYELRDRASEREKLTIETYYYQFAAGDLEKARQAYELWAQTYPRDDVPRTNLCFLYFFLGQFDKALQEAQSALRLDPASGNNYENLVNAYLLVNRFDEARATIQEARAKALETPYMHMFGYILAFLGGDQAGMEQEAAAVMGKPGVEDVLLSWQADIAAYTGLQGKSRELSRRAVASAEQAEEKETAAGYEAGAALREALFGDPAEARQRAAAALALSQGRDVQFTAALALEYIGDTTEAQRLANDLSKRYPKDTIAQFKELPTLNAQLAFRRSQPSRAIEVLQPAAPYDLGFLATNASWYTIYLRGGSCLATHDAGGAADEFQKIIEHPSASLNSIGALARLGLARAYALQGDTVKAKAAYQDFLTLWKNADRDIPILKQAKAEYAKLQ